MPTSIDGIKRLAKRIKRETQASHTDSLDVAAQKAGFQNYAHARRALAGAAITA